MSTVKISHLSKAKVLAAPYNRSKPLGMGMLHYDPTPMTEDEAKELLESSHSKYFDYLKGRVMKIDLSGEELDTYLYNRDLGQNAAENVIKNIS